MIISCTMPSVQHCPRHLLDGLISKFCGIHRSSLVSQGAEVGLGDIIIQEAMLVG